MLFRPLCTSAFANSSHPYFQARAHLQNVFTVEWEGGNKTVLVEVPNADHPSEVEMSGMGGTYGRLADDDEVGWPLLIVLSELLRTYARLHQRLPNVFAREPESQGIHAGYYADLFKLGRHVLSSCSASPQIIP